MEKDDKEEKEAEEDGGRRRKVAQGGGGRGKIKGGARVGGDGESGIGFLILARTGGAREGGRLGRGGEGGVSYLGVDGFFFVEVLRGGGPL